jgi:hypothetical protein
MLIALHRPKDAAREYRAVLKKEPNRRHSLRQLSRTASNN